MVFPKHSLFAILTVSIAAGWSWYDVTEKPIRVSIAEIVPVTDPSAPTPVEVMVENIGGEVVRGRAEIRDLVDAWSVAGRSVAEWTLRPGEKRLLRFNIRSGKPVFSALYPVHVYVDFDAEGRRRQVHAVRIFEVRLPQDRDQALNTPPELSPVTVPPDVRLPLRLVDERTVCWQWFGKPPVWKPVGWRGADPRCRAYFNVQQVARGDRRFALAMHPPWRPEAGTIFCDYRLALPAGTPIALGFGVAIRDNTAAEPPSDGVLFRVWVGQKPDGSDARVVFERFTASKTWEDHRVDLTPWAGKTILLRLESHPGPKRDTTCDLSYWGEPSLVAGDFPSPAEAAAENAARIRQALAAVRDLCGGRSKPDGRRTFLLRGQPPRSGIAVVPGRAGLLDAAFALGMGDRAVAFSGLRIDVDDLPVSPLPSAWACRSMEERAGASGTTWRHLLEFSGRKAELTVQLRADGPGLRIVVSCNRRLTHISVGPWTERAARVFYGHGYCIVDPEPFTAGFGGHNLATSHVAAEFANGLAVLQATDNPPDRFTVTPSSHTYELSTHMNATLTLVPGASAFDCAIAYRPLDPRKPAGGVRRLAGRFCFDIWGGRYADIADHMAEMFLYDLTDSFLTVHNWQRWGYDYRLPDVFPPNPAFGTIEDMRKIARVCGEQDVPWGLHDNYIDFYPDATGYSYRYICFTRDGAPVKAWYNQGRKAQSYRWRPDSILPFVQRNLRVIRRELRPTHYFLDVFTSAGCFDFYDWEGRFHPNVETRKCWGEVFAWIRETLGGNAPTTSEAGHDQLIGWLDGADCQWLSLSPEPKRHTIYLRCNDWERVPWYDAVHHDRFILHGVGYSGRYQGAAPRATHGINSDDYLSAEVLSGHALMVDVGSWGRAAVRKYWFLQDVARHLALRSIRRVTFADGDIHRQEVMWDDGTVVRVNRGKTPWKVEGRTLPQYGFLVRYGKAFYAALEEKNGVLLEHSVGPSGWYVNARTKSPEPSRTVDIQPTIESFERIGERSFRYVMAWHANEPTPKPMHIFVHFCSPSDSDEIVFQDDHAPPVPTDQWKGTIRITRTVELPEKADGDYPFMVGLYGPGGRLGLRGRQTGGSRILVGTLRVTRKNGEIADVRLLPPPPPDPLPRVRLNPKGTTVDAEFASTDGAFRIVRTPSGSGLRLVPLPESGKFNAVLRLKLLAPGRKPVSVQAVGPDGARKGEVPYKFRNGMLVLERIGEAFAYDIRLEPEN